MPSRTEGEGLIVVCAANPYDGVALGDWHLANQMARRAPVLYVDPPVSWATPIGRTGRACGPARPGLRIESEGLARLTPVVQPFPARRATVGLSSLITRHYLRRAVSRLGAHVLAVVSGWPHFEVFGSCGERVRVYWAQDDFVGGAPLLGIDAAMLDKRERRIAAAADLVVAASPVVARTWRDRGANTVLIPYGTDVTAYTAVEDAPVPPDVRLGGPVAGFVGHINDRMDLDMVEAVAERGICVLMVGPKDPAFEPARFGALLRRPNVCWVGPKPFACLPGYLRLMDVGLVPYRDSAFNRGSFPLKTLEYLACGRPVVATDLPAIRWLDTSLIRVASGAGEFADLVSLAAAEPRTPELADRRRQFAAGHTWERRAADMHAAIDAISSGRAKKIGLFSHL